MTDLKKKQAAAPLPNLLSDPMPCLGLSAKSLVFWFRWRQTLQSHYADSSESSVALQLPESQIFCRHICLIDNTRSWFVSTVIHRHRVPHLPCLRTELGWYSLGISSLPLLLSPSLTVSMNPMAVYGMQADWSLNHNSSASKCSPFQDENESLVSVEPAAPLIWSSEQPALICSHFIQPDLLYKEMCYSWDYDEKIGHGRLTKDPWWFHHQPFPTCTWWMLANILTNSSLTV